MAPPPTACLGTGSNHALNKTVRHMGSAVCIGILATFLQCVKVSGSNFSAENNRPRPGLFLCLLRRFTQSRTERNVDIYQRCKQRDRETQIVHRFVLTLLDKIFHVLLRNAPPPKLTADLGRGRLTSQRAVKLNPSDPVGT